MSIFEYLMVLVSIIMGLGVTQVLRGASKIARSRNRYPAVTMLVLLLFYLYVQSWWALWDLSAVVEWNQAWFTLIIIMVCFLFGATELLLPMAASADTDWQDHFYSVRRWFYGTLFCFALVATLETWILLGVPLTHPYRVNQGAVLVLILAGAFVANRRLQPWIAGSIIAAVLAGQVMFRMVPGLA